MLDREFWALKGNPVFRMEAGVAEDRDKSIANMVQVRVDRTRKLAWFQHDDMVLKPGEKVVVETERGTASGEVLTWPLKRWCTGKVMKGVLRRLDVGQQRSIKERTESREAQAMKVCADLIGAFQLEMKLVGVEYVYWENRTVFYFVAEGRVDFRDLVKELSRLLRCRIEMRQIGPRDETKMLGGLGRCGREFCCGTFLNEFRSVRTKMAKEQGLVVNQEKITGHCRKLLCCLAYERESYAALRASLPPLGSIVETEEGPAKVLELLVLKQAVKVNVLDKADGYKVISAAGLRVQGGGAVGVDGLSLLEQGDDEDDSMRDLEDDGEERSGSEDRSKGRGGEGGREGRRGEGRPGDRGDGSRQGAGGRPGGAREGGNRPQGGPVQGRGNERREGPGARKEPGGRGHERRDGERRDGAGVAAPAGERREGQGERREGQGERRGPGGPSRDGRERGERRDDRRPAREPHGPSSSEGAPVASVNEEKPASAQMPEPRPESGSEES